jgi:CheY-like chemotaxis protein
MRPDTRKILLVEDDSDVRGAMAAMLDTAGYSVVEAEHGREALEHLRGGSEFGLILLDLFMPEMNGWAFLAERMSDPGLSTVPVVVISADPDAMQRAKMPGVVARLVKPIEFDRLLAIVRQHC